MMTGRRRQAVHVAPYDPNTYPIKPRYDRLWHEYVLAPEKDRERLRLHEEKIEAKILKRIEDNLEDLEQNVTRINEHGKRADGIVRGMLEHSRGKTGERMPTDVNKLLEEYVNLAYHGMLAQDPTVTVSFEKHYDEFKKLGIDEVICFSVNDAFVMHAWEQGQGVSKVRLMPDGSGEFTRAMGMLVKKGNLGFGERSWRYSMYVDDGEIKKVFDYQYHLKNVKHIFALVALSALPTLATAPVLAGSHVVLFEDGRTLERAPGGERTDIRNEVHRVQELRRTPRPVQHQRR